MRQALNYCIDREGLVALLNGTAEPSVGWLKASDPDFGTPVNRYKFDPAKGKALLAEAGYTPAKPLSFKAHDLEFRLGADAAAADERVPAAESERGLRRQRRVRRDRMAGAADGGARHARQPESARRHGAQYQLAVVRCRRHGALFPAANFSPNGFNFEQWKDDDFEDALKTISESTDPKAISTAYRKAHERLVDNPPWLYIVHDLNPRAMSPKVKGFVSPQSWFVDLTLVSLQ